MLASASPGGWTSDIDCRAVLSAADVRGGSGGRPASDGLGHRSRSSRGAKCAVLRGSLRVARARRSRMAWRLGLRAPVGLGVWSPWFGSRSVSLVRWQSRSGRGPRRRDDGQRPDAASCGQRINALNDDLRDASDQTARLACDAGGHVEDPFTEALRPCVVELDGQPDPPQCRHHIVRYQAEAPPSGGRSRRMRPRSAGLPARRRRRRRWPRAPHRATPRRQAISLRRNEASRSCRRGRTARPEAPAPVSCGRC